MGYETRVTLNDGTQIHIAGDDPTPPGLIAYLQTMDRAELDEYLRIGEHFNRAMAECLARPFDESIL